jgi:dTDP-4-dehydrorhamnose reductase
VYGWIPLEAQSSTSSSGKPINFALWAQNEELKIVKDQYASPTLADVLAAVALRVAARETNDVYGKPPSVYRKNRRCNGIFS